MYKYEMHCHTSETSKCGRATGREMAEFYKEAGYSGIVITDHFLNGNTTVPKDLPWKEKIDLFFAGYEEAKKRGDEIGLSVFFAWENGYQGSDLLIYGLGKEWLLENENCDLLAPKALCELVHEGGGYIAHAHPFRERGYIEMIRLFPRDVDAVEVFNSGNNEFENNLAEIYADSYGLKKICGSDNHSGRLNHPTAVGLPYEAKSIGELIEGIKNGEHILLHCNIKR